MTGLCVIRAGYKAKGQMAGEMGADNKSMGGRVATDRFVCVK